MALPVVSQAVLTLTAQQWSSEGIDEMIKATFADMERNNSFIANVIMGIFKIFQDDPIPHPFVAIIFPTAMIYKMLESQQEANEMAEAWDNRPPAERPEKLPLVEPEIKFSILEAMRSTILPQNWDDKLLPLIAPEMRGTIPFFQFLFDIHQKMAIENPLLASFIAEHYNNYVDGLQNPLMVLYISAFVYSLLNGQRMTDYALKLQKEYRDSHKDSRS